MLRHVPQPIEKAVFDRVGMNSVNPAFLDQPRKGHVGIITQSGILRRSLFSMMVEDGLGLSECVVFDQRNAVEWSELRRIAGDKNTHVIILHLESIQYGRAMMDVGKEITRTKPIIVFKAGKTEAGSRGVLSHTGLLAGSDEICRAAFRQCGMLQATTLEEVIDFAKSFVAYPNARVSGSRIGILSNGGGLGIICADACIEIGLEIPRLSDKCQQILRRDLIFASGISNPIDLGAAATSRDYCLTLETLLDSKAVDILIVIVTPTPMLNVAHLANFLVGFVKTCNLPIIVCASGGSRFVKYLRDLVEELPLFPLPERAATGAFSLAFSARLVSRKASANVSGPNPRQRNVGN